MAIVGPEDFRLQQIKQAFLTKGGLGEEIEDLVAVGEGKSGGVSSSGLQLASYAFENKMREKCQRGSKWSKMFKVKEPVGEKGRIRPRDQSRFKLLEP